MNKPCNVPLIVAITALCFVNQAFAARGGGAQHSGGGAPHSSGGPQHSGGGAHQSFGHAPTFSMPNAHPAPSFHAQAPRSFSQQQPAFHNEVHPNSGVRPAIENRPEFAHQPGIAGRPGGANYYGLEGHPQNHQDYFNRPGIAEHPGLGVRPSVINHPEDFNRYGAGNRGGFAPGYAGYGHNQLAGSWYHGDWHDHWNNQNWYGRPSWWQGSDWWGAGYLPGYAAWQIPWSWGYWSYSNPYYTQPLTFGTTTIDYSQPIMMETAPTATVADQGTAQQQAAQLLDSARDAFAQGNYQSALAQVDSAIAILPSDAVLHEFRGLALFAIGDYRQAASSVYAALSVGPGWDWTTLSSLYPDIDIYTKQLRALEQYARANPSQSDARFLLAYQYLTCGYSAQAVVELQDVVRLNPKDQLSAQLLASLTAPHSAAPEATPTTPAPAVPLTATALAGHWTATRPGGGAILLDLGTDSKYDWNNGQAHNFTGTYTVADNVLILKQGDTPAMVGQITPINGRQFNFKMAGNNSNDRGLTFTRS